MDEYGVETAADIETAADKEQPSPIANLDEVVHQKTRLGILAVLSEAREADFTYLRTALGLTDGNLGRHLEILAAAGLVSTRKGYDGRRSRTWARITPVGATALSIEITALKSLIKGFEDSIDG